VMRYTNGVCVKATYDASGNIVSSESVYTNNAGTLTYSAAADSLTWNDGRNTSGTFVRSVAPVNVTPTPAVNEWVETSDLNAAVAASGVSFSPPVTEALPNGLSLTTYRSRPGIIEARYGSSLIIRKSNTVGGSELSGDYNTYSRTWDITLKGLGVHCRGDGTTVNEATFSAGGNYYSLSCNPGREGSGLTPDQINSLVNGMS